MASCDSVIVICTPAYAEKTNNREGGVGYESTVITGGCAKQINSGKFIPVLAVELGNRPTSTHLRSKRGVDLRSDPLV